MSFSGDVSKAGLLFCMILDALFCVSLGLVASVALLASPLKEIKIISSSSIRAPFVLSWLSPGDVVVDSAVTAGSEFQILLKLKLGSEFPILLPCSIDSFPLGAASERFAKVTMTHTNVKAKMALNWLGLILQVFCTQKPNSN